MKKKLIIFSGAGMSAESGISTFRDSGGLWEQYKIEDVATPEAWKRNPDLVTDFYNPKILMIYMSELVQKMFCIYMEIFVLQNHQVQNKKKSIIRLKVGN
jgi:NAD-dependent SIR2 family protein deacetylase